MKTKRLSEALQKRNNITFSIVGIYVYFNEKNYNNY